jgi:hypothetical protein
MVVIVMENPYRLGASLIHGVGIFATRPLWYGDYIQDVLTIFSPVMLLDNFNGFNHSCDPNLLLDARGDLNRTLKDVKAGDEFTISYDFTGMKPKDCNCQVCAGRKNEHIILQRFGGILATQTTYRSSSGSYRLCLPITNASA